MAKGTQNNYAETQAQSPDDIFASATMTAPKGSKTVNTSTDGFWDEECRYPLHCKVLFGRTIVPTRGPSKGKRRDYAVVELLAPTMLKEMKGDSPKPARAAAKGEVIAVWLPPGLDDLRLLAGADVWVKRKPESEWKDTGKGNPMKTYDVRYISGARAQLKIVPFASATDGVSGSGGEAPPVNPDEIPF